MCFSIVKYLLFAFNVFFWMAGCVILAIGIWLNTDPTFRDSITISGVEIYYAGAIVFIIAGSLMLVFGFFGCLGAIKENRILLGIYFVCLFISFGLQFGIGIWAAVSYDSLEEVINENMMKIDFSEATTDNVLLSVEKNLQCCGGYEGCSDWGDETMSSTGCGCDKESKNCVPASSLKCGVDSTMDKQTSLIYKESCASAVYDMVEENMLIIAGIGIAIALTEFFGMIFAGSMIAKGKK